MISKKVIDYFSKIKNIGELDLLEKDLRLHLLLKELIANEKYGSKLIFKGGTCLTKCYLGYYRFSEDLDFTWDSQDFTLCSGKVLRRTLSQLIDDLGRELEIIAQKNDLDFKIEKNNKKYLEFGANNKFVTFKFWYKSVILSEDIFIKIQINFTESLLYPITVCGAKSLFSELNPIEIEDSEFIFPNSKNLFSPIMCKCYSLEEILVEKNRAILTRRGVKYRDFIDVYLILNNLNQKIEFFESKIIAKTKPVLEKYEKYMQNFMLKKLNKFDVNMKIKEGESRLLLKELPKEFNSFTLKYLDYLNKLLNRIELDTKRKGNCN